MATNNSNLFTSLFAQFNDVEALRSYANEILVQVKEAFDGRSLEIAKAGKATPTAAAPKAPKAAKAKTAKTAEKPAKAEEAPAEKADGGETHISITDTEAIKKLDLTFVKYPDSSFWALYGDTKQIKDIIRNDLGGQFCSNLKRIQEGLKGWMFKEDKAANVARTLGLKVKVA